MTAVYETDSIPVHEIGASRMLTATVRKALTDAQRAAGQLEGDLVDPTVLTFTMREPDNTRTTYILGVSAELEHDSVGVFHVYWACTKPGKHRWRFAASGNIGAAEETAFIVVPSEVLA